MGVAAPQRHRVSTRIYGERVRDLCSAQSRIKCAIVGEKAPIVTADVEAEERRVLGELAAQPGAAGDGRGRVGRPRAEIEDVQPARIGRLEVPTPGLDGAVGGEVTQSDVGGAVSARGEADQDPARPIADGSIPRVDAAR